MFFEINGGPNGSNTNKRPRKDSNSYVSDFIKLPRTPLYKDKDFLAQKYIEEGLSIRQIASQIKSSRAAVVKGLKDNNIPIREAHKPHQHQSQPRYGTKKQQGKVVRHLAEEKVIKTVKGLRTQGMSLRQIAQFLSNIGVPIKCRGKKWHPEMVKRILNRA